MTKRILHAVAALAAAAHSWAAPAPSAEIRIGMIGDIRSTNPGVVGRDFTSDSVLHHVTEGLVAVKDDLTIAPVLAESFTASADATAYTFKLRKDARFQNGAPLRAADVKWSFERLLKPETQYQCRAYYDGSELPGIQAIETPDEQTVVIRLSGANSLFLPMIAAVNCTPMILHRDSVGPNGAWLKPIGTGPYALKEWKRDRYVLLERSPHYRARTDARSGLAGKREPLAEHIRWIVINDVAAARAALQSGQIDLVYSVGPGRARDFLAGGKFKLSRSAGLSRRMILMSQRNPALADIRMRRAIAMAIDPEVMNKVVEAGQATINPSVVPVISPYRTPAHAQGYKHDIAAAKTLLGGAGYRGAPLAIKTTKLYPEFYDSAIVLQSQLKAIGINAQIEVLEWPTLLNDYLNDNFQLLTWQFSPRTDAALDYADVLGPKAKYRDLQWDNPTAFALLVKAGGEPEFEARRGLYQEIHEMMLRDVPFANLMDSPVLDVVSPRLEGYAAWPGATPRLWGVRVK